MVCSHRMECSCQASKDVRSRRLDLLSVGRRKRAVNSGLLLGREKGGERTCWLEPGRWSERMEVAGWQPMGKGTGTPTAGQGHKGLYI